MRVGRVLRTGLSSLRDRAANLRRRLAGFNPSRWQRIAGVGIALFIVGAILGAQGHVWLGLFDFALAAICLWQLYKEADEL